MTDLSMSTISARARSIPPDAISALRSGLQGQACLAGEPGYDEGRTLWNATVDRFPGVVVRCANTSDVQRAVDFARTERLPLAVRGGGHNIAGNAVCDDGVVIDLSPIKTVQVDSGARTARVGPGATLADVDAATQAHGLAVPTGINSTTGIAGLTLGGGFGWLTRKFGMTIDSLIAAEVVTADGKLRRASAEENFDLFWAIRGGGGNFGVVTSFTFQLHPVGPEVLSGLVVHPFDNAAELLRDYQRIVSKAPDELNCWVVMRKAPPLPFLPEEWHGRDVLVFAMCYAGDMAAGERATAELRALGKPIADVVSPHPFVGWQKAFDPLLTPGARNYWKTHDFERLDEGLIDTLVGAISGLPGPECEIFIASIGGAMARVAPDATAYPHRNAHFTMNVHTRWREKAGDSGHIQWARQLFKETERFAMGSAYVNFMPDDEADRIEKVYGSNYRRLAEIKRRYDPANLFRLNQNIRPGGQH